MLLQAVNKFMVASRDYKEASKAQYTDKGDVKNYFRASELGSGDRKIMYGFFKHQIPTISRSAKSLRILENGDYVHQRYQKMWEDMGVLISMEERLTSKDDEYLGKYDWEWAGHYDALLDVNILRAHAKGLCTIGYIKNEDTGDFELEVDLDDEYAKQIGIFDADGNVSESYEPVTMVADIKTMNPWGFKRVAQGDVSEIRGYVDQISFYMYMLNTPYGSIFIEDKASNDIVEVQILWHNMYEGTEYAFDPEIHGEPANGILRIVIDTERFFGSDKVLGVVARINQLWETKKLLEQAYLDGTDMTSIMPQRCCEEPSKFPCSWSDGKEKCEFFDHCWNQHTQGIAITGWVACPEDCKWEIATPDGEAIIVDNRKVPEGVTQEALQALVAMGAMDISMFLVDDEVVAIEEAEETALNSDHLFSADGELRLDVAPPAAAEPEDNDEADIKPPAAAIPGMPIHGAAAPLPAGSVFPTTEGQSADLVPDAVIPGMPIYGAAAPGTPKVFRGGPKPTAKPDVAGSALPNTAIEYLNKSHKKAIKCLNCGKENTYERLANGGTKKCEFCQHVNKVLRG